MKNSRGYTKKQTGSRNTKGVARVGGNRRTVNPWGNNVPKATGRRANAVGQTVARSKGLRNPSRRPTPDASLWSIDYPKNDPAAWPIEGGKRGPTSAMTQHKADVHNAAVEQAYTRAGY